MITPIFGSALTALTSTSVVDYWYAVSTYSGTPGTTEATREIPFPNTFTIGTLIVQLTTAPGGTASWDYTVYKNGIATALTVNISGTNTTATDSVHTVTFNAGDTISIASSPNTAPVAPGNVSWSMLADSGAGNYGVLLGADQTTASTTATVYAQPYGGNAFTWSATETDAEGLVATRGTLNNLYVQTTAAPGTSKSYAFTVEQNGSPSALTTTISNAATTGNDAAHTVTIAAGDSISIQAVPTGTPTAPMVSWGIQWNPTTNGESIFGYGNAALPSATATNYEQGFGNGRGSWNATESARYFIPGAVTMTALYVKLITAPGVGNSRSFTLRNNSAASTLTVTISGASTTANITGQSVSITQGNTLDLQSAITATPAAATGGVHTGFVIYNAPAASTASTPTLMMLGLGC